MVSGRPAQPCSHDNKRLVIQDPSPDRETLAEFVRCWFCLPCRWLEGYTKDTAAIHQRRHDGHAQLHTLPIHELLASLKEKHRDGFAFVAMTMFDLYPNPEWNFVFGEANPAQGTGVFSFARYHPFFGHNGSKQRSDGGDDAEIAVLFLRRCLSVLVHELGHLFYIAHCVFWECNMNGSNHLEESNSRPLHLCPMDLRKVCCVTNSSTPLSPHSPIHPPWLPPVYPVTVAALGGEPRRPRLVPRAGAVLGTARVLRSQQPAGGSCMGGKSISVRRAAVI